MAFDYATLKLLASDLRFPEGPIAFDDGSVLVVEIEGDGVARIDADGSVTRTPTGPGPNGQALGPDGAVYVGHDGGLEFTTVDGIRFPCALAEGNPGGSIDRLDLATGKVTPVFAESGGARLGGLNDIVFDTDGRCYAVDTGRGLIHYADPAAGTIEVAAKGLRFPNGMGLSPDGRTLYVSETYSGLIIALDVEEPGKLTNHREHYSTGGAHGWDGLAIDGAGNICGANLAESGVTVISPTGEKLDAFRTPEYDSYVTNICFGGVDGNTAYICSSGRGKLYSVRWPWPGLRVNYAR